MRDCYTIFEGCRWRSPEGAAREHSNPDFTDGRGEKPPPREHKTPRPTADREQPQKQKKIKDCSSRFVEDRVGRESVVGDGLQCGRGINGYNLFLGGKRRLLVIGWTWWSRPSVTILLSDGWYLSVQIPSMIVDWGIYIVLVGQHVTATLHTEVLGSGLGITSDG